MQIQHKSNTKDTITANVVLNGNSRIHKKKLNFNLSTTFQQANTINTNDSSWYYWVILLHDNLRTDENHLGENTVRGFLYFLTHRIVKACSLMYEL